jgi:hypothetical protein
VVWSDTAPFRPYGGAVPGLQSDNLQVLVEVKPR